MKQFLTVMLIIISLSVVSQNYTKCKVYQYAGFDSLNKKLVSVETYNSNGQLTSFYYKGFQESSSESNVDSEYSNFYQDSLLVLSTSIDEDKDSSKIIFYYNKFGQKVKEEHFDYTRRLKKDSNKGRGRSGGCVVTKKDYEKKRSWVQTSEINFSYDTNGNKILYDATKLHYTSQNKYTWSYDSLGRILNYLSFENQRLMWKEEYSYFKGGYKFTRTWYDFNGIPNHLKEKSYEYWPQYTFTYKLNDNGQVVEEKVVTEKSELKSIKIYLYNSYGKIIRSTNFNSKGQPEITHIYLYE
jgi:hypothetical protein